MSKETLENNNKTKTICFTGPHPERLCGYDFSNYLDFVSNLMKIVVDAYNNGYTRFISGGSQGFDQLAFRAVDMVKMRYNYNIENIFYLPFPEYGSQWGEEKMFDFDVLKDKATSIIYTSDDNKNGITLKLIERNHAMVDASDYVIALSPINHSLSGVTGECVAYAVKQKKDVGYIDYIVTNDGLRIHKCVKAYDKGDRLLYA